MGSEEGDLTDDAAFFRHSRDIESAFSVQLFVISAGPELGLSECGRLCGLPYPAIPLEEGGQDGVRNRASWVVDWGTSVEPQDVTRRLRA
ncbi:hypothetical protein S23_63870 [Bradyrhizobium cosmicum]|uniref:Uncharacterized protein n=1 Tax=Bradyrhizobium cosmicum TaxID=1404864 RepID=A0AAI8QFJ7_9BRAD|nr:hypothetical protein S23_63870 [Bradyrhizobium cosmicum]